MGGYVTSATVIIAEMVMVNSVIGGVVKRTGQRLCKQSRFIVVCLRIVYAYPAKTRTRPNLNVPPYPTTSCYNPSSLPDSLHTSPIRDMSRSASRDLPPLLAVECPVHPHRLHPHQVPAHQLHFTPTLSAGPALTLPAQSSPAIYALPPRPRPDPTELRSRLIRLHFVPLCLTLKPTLCILPLPQALYPSRPLLTQPTSYVIHSEINNMVL